MAQEVQGFLRSRASDIQQTRLFVTVLVSVGQLDVAMDGIIADFRARANRANNFTLRPVPSRQIEPRQYTSIALTGLPTKAVKQDVIKLQTLRTVHRHDLQACRF